MMRGKGFTLIEVVVAIAILGVGLMGIIELFSGGLRLGRTSAEYTKAVNYAHMKMEEIVIKQKVEEGVEEGEIDNTYRWQLGVKKLEILPVEKGSDFKPPVELLQIQVSITWKSGSKEKLTRIESYKTIRSEDGEKKS